MLTHISVIPDLYLILSTKHSHSSFSKNRCFFFFFISAHAQAGPYVIKVIFILLHLPQLCQPTHRSLMQQVQNCIAKTDNNKNKGIAMANESNQASRALENIPMTSFKDDCRQKKTFWQPVLDCYYEKLCERVDTDECCYYKQANKSTCLHACVTDH